MEFTSPASRGRDRLRRVSKQMLAAGPSALRNAQHRAPSPDRREGYRVGEEAVCPARGEGTALRTRPGSRFSPCAQQEESRARGWSGHVLTRKQVGAVGRAA